MRYVNMSARRFFTAVGILAITTSPLALIACAPQSDVSAVVQLDKQLVLKPDPALVTGTLENGIRYAILPNQTPPGTGALRVQFDTGSLNELPGTEGLAHYLEHMAFNGSKNVPEGEMIKILERLGLSFGADTNASTGLDRTVYKLNLPTLEKEVLDAAFMLMGETAYNLTLDQDAIERELGIILSEKRTRDSASYRSWEARLRFITDGSDIMDRLPIGTEEGLNTIKADDFKAYYKAHYHPDKTFVAFVGDAGPDIILEYIEKTFGDWNPETEAAEDRPLIPADTQSGRIGYYFEEGLPTQMSLMALEPYEERDDTAQNRFDRLVDRIGFGMMGYRMREITEQADRPFISAGMSFGSTLKLTQGTSFTAYTQPENWKRALGGLDLELRKLLKHGFTQAELDAQLARLQSSYEARAEGADTRRTTSRFGGLIDSLMASHDNETVFTHPTQQLEMFNAVKQYMTLEAVNESLRENWGNLSDLSVYVVSDTEIPDAENTIRQALLDAQSAPVPTPDQNEGATEFAYQDFGPAGEIVSDEYIEDIDAHLIKFANNVRLNFKKTDFSEDRVSIQVQFGEGMLSTPRKDEGLRRMMFGVMGGSGYEAHTPSETSRLMAGKIISPARISASEGSDTFNISGGTVPDNFRDQLNLMTASLTAPGFREDARQTHIDKLKAWYPRHDTTMEGVRSKYMGRFLRDGDKRWGFDNEDMFYSPTVEDIKTWLEPQLNEGLIEITVIGDIDKETVIEEVSETFGALPDRRDSRLDLPEMRDVKLPEGTKTPHIITHRADENQAQLRIYWPAGDGLEVKYARQLSVLRAILRNRLVKEIREGEATTYSPGAGSSASTVFPGYGYIFSVLTLKPEDIPAMSSIVRDIAADMSGGNITEDEFNRAITPMLERLKSEDKQNGYWLNVLSDAQTDALGLERHMNRESILKEMKTADIRALAKEVFINEKSIEIHILPEEDS